jgi:hypothetical protein
MDTDDPIIWFIFAGWRPGAAGESGAVFPVPVNSERVGSTIVVRQK